jgi:hypothetical protein
VAPKPQQAASNKLQAEERKGAHLSVRLLLVAVAFVATLAIIEISFHAATALVALDALVALVALDGLDGFFKQFSVPGSRFSV